MLDQEFNAGNIQSVNFGVHVRDGEHYFVPVDGGVQDSLGDMLRTTIQGFQQIDSEWEEFSESEEYGPNRRIYAARNNDLMDVLSALYEMGDLADMANLMNHAQQIDFYFAVYRDNQNRKAVGVKKAIRFKGTLSEKGRLIRVSDNSFELIDDDVFRLDFEFDAIIANQRVYIRNAQYTEYLADIVNLVAGAAQQKIQDIEQSVTFLDLSRIADKIEHHPRTARLASSIAARADLADIKKEYVEQMAEAQGIGFVATNDGRLKPRVQDEHKLLEILDDRRYTSELTGGNPVPFRAPSRQRVQP